MQTCVRAINESEGAIAELKIAAAAAELGIPVLRPMTDHCRFDMAFEISDRILRVQCKWGSVDHQRGVIRVNLQTFSLTYEGQRRRSYAENEIDLLAIYCGGIDRCYLLPSALIAGRRAIHLRLRRARNGQRACLNDAAEYEFAGAIAQQGERLRGTQEVAGSSPASSTPSSTDVGTNDFRKRFGYYLERAAAGDEICVSRHGRPCARLVPAQPSLAAGWIA
jgi:prevent-host-death family protein